MPLVHLERTLYCSNIGDGEFEVALVVSWLYSHFFGKVSTLKIPVFLLVNYLLFLVDYIDHITCIGAALLHVKIPYLFASSKVHSKTGKV